MLATQLGALDLQPRARGRIVHPVMGTRRQASIRIRAVFIVLVAVGALVCLGDLAGPAMAMADGHGCPGPGCDQQIAASRALHFEAPSRPATDLIAIAAAVVANLPLAQEYTAAMDAPHDWLVWLSLAPFAPRSPPAA